MWSSGTAYLSDDLFHWASVIKIQLSMLVLYNADIIISSKCNLFLPWSGVDPGIQVSGGGHT